MVSSSQFSCALLMSSSIKELRHFYYLLELSFDVYQNSSNLHKTETNDLKKMYVDCLFADENRKAELLTILNIANLSDPNITIEQLLDKFRHKIAIEKIEKK